MTRVLLQDRLMARVLLPVSLVGVFQVDDDLRFLPFFVDFLTGFFSREPSVASASSGGTRRGRAASSFFLLHLRPVRLTSGSRSSNIAARRTTDQLIMSLCVAIAKMNRRISLSRLSGEPRRLLDFVAAVVRLDLAPFQPHQLRSVLDRGPAGRIHRLAKERERDASGSEGADERENCLPEAHLGILLNLVLQISTRRLYRDSGVPFEPRDELE